VLLRSKVVTSKVLALASVLVAGAFVGSACSTVNPSAATVNGQSIDRSSFNDSLHEFAGNPAFIARVSQSGQASVTGNGAGTVSADFARQALQREIVVLVAQQENESRGAKVTPEIEAAARDDVQSQFGLDAFNGFSKSFQQHLVDQNSQIYALRANVAGSSLDDAALEKVFNADPSQFAEVCASHILVNTKAEADAVEKRLADGEDFATVAKDVSIDTGSAANGGDLGCIARGITVKEFEDALFATPVGTTSQPVQTQFGYHVIKVTDKKAPAFKDAKPQVLQKIFNDSNDKFNTVLNGGLTKAKVTVDPRYGQWNTSLNAVVPANLAGLQGSTATTGATASTGATGSTGSTATTAATPTTGG
jgi:parvulin-like peptidyl-prolyl isomerase